ncbi:MAG: nucleotidyltransferase family protein [Candidatus Aenigmarchaeota archaeon]|nr:nucleotidyltransferase family protein [Candidatus Aenigmarchaeota archaeon]
MKALVLAGGFAKRLLPLTAETPKALLPLKGRPLLEHVLRKIEPLEGIDQVCIAVNARFEAQFALFLQRYRSRKMLRLVVEPAREEGEKLGSVGGIGHFLRSEQVEGPLLVMAGDNVLESGLFGLLLLYRERKATVVGVTDVRDPSRAARYGVVELDPKGKITSFEEKPSQPRSTLASTGVYVLTGPVVALVPQYLRDHQGDRMGDFIAWLVRREPVYGYVFPGKWFDIGSAEEYQQAERELE